MACQSLLGSYWDAQLAQNLLADLPFPISVVRREPRGFEIEGVPTELLRKWSKRRDDVVCAMSGMPTKGHRAASVRAAKRTRGCKSELPPTSELERRHEAELASLGLTKDAVMAAVIAAGERASALRPPPDIERRQRRRYIISAGRQAVREMIKQDAVLDVRVIKHAIAEELMGVGNIDEIEAEFARQVVDGELVMLAADDGEVRYTTPSVRELERSVLRMGLAGQGDRIFVGPADIEMSDLAWYALAECGRVGCLAADADVASLVSACKARSVPLVEVGQGADVVEFIRQVEMKKRALRPATVILVKEADKLPLRAIHRLVELADEHDLYVRLVATPRRRPSLADGAAYRALSRLLGDSRLVDVRSHQMVDWQRQASQALATSHIPDAIHAYDQHDCIRWEQGREAAVQRIVDSVEDDVRLRPYGSRLVLCTSNRDMAELSIGLRDVYRRAGIITGPDNLVPAMTRAEIPRTVMLPIAAGDRIILNEDAGDVLDGSMGTIVAVVVGDASPSIRIRWEDGRETFGAWSELVGPKSTGKPPRISYCHACTVAVVQRQVADHVWVYIDAEMRSEALFIALTRHTEAIELVVDTSAAREGLGIIGVDAETLEHIKAELIRSWCRSAGRRSVSDYTDDLRAWAMESPPPASEATTDFLAGLLGSKKEGAEAERPEFEAKPLLVPPALLKCCRRCRAAVTAMPQDCGGEVPPIRGRG